MNEIKYTHTNIVAKDWKRLADFYIKVFNCEPIYPERDLSGQWLEKLTNIKNAAIKGIHLRLPGYESGPTLEIFQYNEHNLHKEQEKINYQGFAHIAFHVDSVEDVLKSLEKNGGEKLSEIITKDFDNVGKLIVVYARDPEGNYVEIQKWEK